MTREEAIKILTEIQTKHKKYIGQIECNNALNMAIEALQTEPVCEHFYKGYCSRFEDGCFCQCRKG